MIFWVGIDGSSFVLVFPLNSGPAIVSPLKLILLGVIVSYECCCLTSFQLLFQGSPVHILGLQCQILL
jgi:hypothetical protein